MRGVRLGGTLSGSSRKCVAIGRPLQAVSTAQSKRCPDSHILARWSRGVLGTYVLSFAARRLSKNLRPLVVVVSTVSTWPVSPCTATHNISQSGYRSWVHCVPGIASPDEASAEDLGRCSGGRGGVGGGGVEEVLSSAGVALLVQEPIPHLSPDACPSPPQHRRHCLRNCERLHLCTYRLLLSFRRASIVFRARSAGGFALRGAFHFVSNAIACPDYPAGCKFQERAMACGGCSGLRTGLQVSTL